MSPGNRVEDGLIEIYYIDEDPNNQAVDLWSCVRWTPRSLMASQAGNVQLSLPFDDPINTIPYLQDLTDQQLADAFDDLGQPFSFRMDRPAASRKTWKRRLVFKGGNVFDQFEIRSEAVQRTHRWMLARSYQQLARIFHSEVAIEVGGDSAGSESARFRLNLALPTPTPQCVIAPANSTSLTPTYALAFRALYRTAIPKAWYPPDMPPRIRELGIGPGPADAEVRDSDVDFPENDIPHDYLGGFGFSRSDGHADFFFFPRRNLPDRKFWVTEARDFREGLLARFANVDPSFDGQFSIKTDQGVGEKWNSIRFYSEGQTRTATRVVFRHGITVQQEQQAEPKGDLWVRRMDPNNAGSKSFALRDPTRSDRWVTTETTDLFVEIELKYEIADNDIWSVIDDVSVVAATVDLRLGFESEIRSDTGEGDIAGIPSTFSDLDPNIAPTANDFFGRAIKGMRLARLDLRNIEATQPQSALPDIKIANSRTLRFALCGRVDAHFTTVDDGVGEITRIAWGKPMPRKPSWPAAEMRLTLWPQDSLVVGSGEGSWSETANTEIRARAAARSLFYAKDAKDSAWDTFDLTITHDPDTYRGDSPQLCMFRLTRTQNSTDKSQKGRLGGLEFEAESGSALAPDGVTADNYSHWRFSSRILEVPTGGKWAGYRATDVDLRLRFSLVSIHPVGVDIPWGDRTNRPRPLLIEASDAGSRAKFILDLRETVSDASDRQLLASVIDQTEPAENIAASTAFTVISEEPFSIVKFSSERLQERGSQENSAVATYDSDRRSWEFKLTSPTYHYEYPPQVIGESMDKPNRLEIHDPIHTDSDYGWPRPYHPDDGDDGVMRRRAVEFRLAPSAELWVRPSDVGRGYFLPEWASHEIFRQRGELGLGAAMAAFRGEFLYGLTVGIETSKEESRSRGARVAEIEALTGKPLQHFRASGPDDKLARRWAGVSRSLARRPERLEVWAADAESAMPFGLASFRTGTRFALRNTAVHRYALQEFERGAASLRRIEAGDGGPRVRVHGLSGGALWPLESANFYRTMLANPGSSGGSIERIALSPGGGDADQKAEFLRGQLSIISETRDGFVQRHQVEVIGRIAGFWHRAKHVVVYARTSSPSAQFTPPGGIGSRSRRPILRKVSEYIELLQPAREYPDFTTAKPTSSGFLKAVRFNSNIINVDSAWSEDVGDYGWKIPLWNRDSARMRPQVYPMPDIGFITVASGEGEQPSATQECLDPDKIYFFADSQIGGIDTDAWPSRIGIDCVNLPAPRASFETNQKSNVTGEAKRASTPRGIRGHQRFTWRLAPASGKTALNAERAGQPIYVGLESVTFMRSSPVLEESLLVAAIKKAAELPFPTVRLAYWAPGGEPPEELSDIGRAINNFTAAAGSGNDQEVLNTASVLLTEAQKLPAELAAGGLSKHLAEAKGYASFLGDLRQNTGDLVQGVGSRCTALVDDFAGSITRKQLLVLDAIRSWETSIQRIGDISVGSRLSKDELIDKLTGVVAAVIQPAVWDFAPDVGGIKESTEKARSVVRGVEHDIDNALSKALAELDAVKQNYDQAKPWSTQRLREFQQQLARIRSGIQEEMLAAVGEAQARLSTELDQLANMMIRQVSVALQSLTDGETSLLATLGRSEGAATALLLAVDGKIGQILGENGGTDLFAALSGRLDEAIGKLGQQQNKDVLIRVKTALAAVKAQVLSSRTRLRDAARVAGDEIADLEAAITSATTEVTNLLTQVASFVNSSKTDIDQIAEDGFDELKDGLFSVIDQIFAAARRPLSVMAGLGEAVDPAIERARSAIAQTVGATREAIAPIFAVIDEAFMTINQELSSLQIMLSAQSVQNLIRNAILKPAVEDLLAGVDFEMFRPVTQESLAALKTFLHDTSYYVEQGFKGISDGALADIRTKATELCTTLGGGLEEAYELIENIQGELEDQADAIAVRLGGALNDVTALRNLAQGLASDIRSFSNELAGSHAAANAYADRVLDAVGNLNGGGLSSVPNNILRLYAAVASAPQLPNLSFDRERLGYYYNALNDIIDTSPAEAWFGKLGDELKALGLSLPFNQIGDRLIPDDLSRLDVGRVFKNFGGLKLDNLFKGYKLPAEAKDAIKITHSFDKKEFRAWVQIDVDLPMPGRRALFSVGPFQLDFVESRLLGRVRLQSSKDSDRVEQTGRASFNTNIEAVVSGQMMVALQKVAVIYDKSSGLNVEFDPKNIRLNPAFRFVQDTLGSLFGDELGGLKLIKSNGIPVGMEHEFSMPPVSLMYATSGVSNIQISNHFSLIAYPDFVISNRFSLSKPEMPFLFSIFIIGGTGYITVDTEYRPFKNELMVVVEAAAGGSAALGFSFGPISGSVFITLSVALAYRRIGRSSSGVTVSLVLLVAGNVSVAGIVNIYMGLLLRMSYHDNGQIDATGTLNVTIRISRFFKITARANVQYKLRGGKSQTTTSVGAQTQITDEQLSKAKDKVDKFLGAKG
ncbi:hypothetical protein [Mesorhizobium sp. M0013]|uniref:hypothetical protein n=1 Tax=Mesorhizobium sp. M0013 TaxID=2956841 RepID=UPI003334B92B